MNFKSTTHTQRLPIGLTPVLEVQKHKMHKHMRHSTEQENARPISLWHLYTQHKCMTCAGIESVVIHGGGGVKPVVCATYAAAPRADAMLNIGTL